MSTRSIKSYSDEKNWYNSDAGVDRLSSWYVAEKEVAFIDFILNRMPIPATGPVVELGGGAGLQGLHWRKRIGERYLHTDYAAPMVEKARDLGLASEEMDGLNMPFEAGAVAGALLVGTSTIIWDVDMRLNQFREVHRVLQSGGTAVFVSSRLAGLRYGFKMTRRDIDALKEMGFDILVYRDWGIVPGRFWSQGTAPLFAGIENFLSAIGVGIRRTVIVRKR